MVASGWTLTRSCCCGFSSCVCPHILTLNCGWDCVRLSDTCMLHSHSDCILKSISCSEVLVRDIYFVNTLIVWGLTCILEWTIAPAMLVISHCPLFTLEKIRYPVCVLPICTFRRCVIFLKSQMFLQPATVFSVPSVR